MHKVGVWTGRTGHKVTRFGMRKVKETHNPCKHQNPGQLALLQSVWSLQVSRLETELPTWSLTGIFSLSLTANLLRILMWEHKLTADHRPQGRIIARFCLQECLSDDTFSLKHKSVLEASHQNRLLMLLVLHGQNCQVPSFCPLTPRI